MLVQLNWVLARGSPHSNQSTRSILECLSLLQGVNAALHNHHSWLMGHGGLFLQEAPRAMPIRSSAIYLLLRCRSRDTQVFGSPLTPHYLPGTGCPLYWGPSQT